jgi:hypothetical protein
LRRVRPTTGGDPTAGGTVSLALTVTTIALLATALRGSSVSGRQATTGEPRAFRDTQIWARTCTSPDTGFIVAGTSVYGGWRNLAHRPVISPEPIGNTYFYPQSAMTYNERLARFYAEHCRIDAGTALRRLHPLSCHGLFVTLDEAGLSDFARSFGAQYLVRKTHQPPLAFPLAYCNDYYTVYRLTAGSTPP